MRIYRVVLALTALAAVLAPSTSAAAVRSRELQIKRGQETLQAFVAWDDARTERRPGVMIVHGGWGYTDYVRKQAERLAAAGYVGFAFDMFAAGKVDTHLDHAGGVMGELDKNPSLVKARFDAALDLFKRDPHVNAADISAMGNCWGGTVVLNMGRAGADLDAVVVFHGALNTATPARKGQFKPRVLVMNGGADPLVPVAQVEPFKKEMADAGVSAEVVLLSGAKHSYANPYADHAGSPAMAYSAAADKESWARLLRLLTEVYR